MVDPNIWKNRIEQFLYLYGLYEDDPFNISNIPSIPDIDTIKTAADVTHIWESPTARIKWRNLTSEEKQAYTVISHTEQCEPSVALLKFIGIDEDVLMILSTTDSSSTNQLKEQLIKKDKVVITEEKKNIKAALKKYHCQVLLLLLSETDALTNSEMEDISLLFKGNKIICCCCILFKGNKIICCCMGISSLSFQCLFSAFEEVPIGGKMGEDNSYKFFIRKFEDKLGSSNAAQWYCNELTSAERKEYTIMTTDELEKSKNCKRESSLLFFMLKEAVNDSPTEEEFFMLVDFIVARVSNLNLKLVLFRDVVGLHLPQKIEIDAMIKFIGTAPVLSVFSGLAFIENLLKLRGVNVRATDNYSCMFGDPWMPVESMDAVEAVKTYCNNNNKVLFMSWPTPQNSVKPSDAFYVLQEFKGQKVIYIGANTSCACYDFLNLLENNFEYVESNVPYCKVNFSEVRFYIRT